MSVAAARDPELPFRPLRRAEYDRLVALGCFDDEKVELLFGVLVPMSPTNDPHAYAVERLGMALVPLAIAARARVRIQSPMAASDDSEPEPDVLIAPIDDAPGAHPTAAHLVVEVAESSLAKDLGAKARLYAATAVGEYWVVDVVHRTVVVHRDPVDGAWRSITEHRLGDVLSPLAFPDLSVAVASLFFGA